MIRFYTYFLPTQTGQMLQKTSSEDKYIMFSVFLNYLITHIVNPTLLTEHLYSIRQKFAEFGILIESTDYFINSFLNAFKELLQEEKDTNIVELWSRELQDFMVVLGKI